MVALIHQLLELADLQKDLAAMSRVPWHSQLHRLPRVLVLFAVVDAAGELRITVAIGDAPAHTTAVFDLTPEAAKPLLLRHVSRKFPMRRIMRRNGQTWDYPGRTRCAGRVPLNTRKPRQSLGVFNGAKRIRTADPLHAMQVLYQLSYGPDRCALA